MRIPSLFRDMALLCRRPTKLHKSSSNNLVSRLPGEATNVFFSAEISPNIDMWWGSDAQGGVLLSERLSIPPRNQFYPPGTSMIFLGKSRSNKILVSQPSYFQASQSCTATSSGGPSSCLAWALEQHYWQSKWETSIHNYSGRTFEGELATQVHLLCYHCKVNQSKLLRKF